MPCQLKQLKELGTGLNCKPVMNYRPEPDIRPGHYCSYVKEVTK